MTKTRFRIYTEYVHSRHIVEIVDKYFADYSMFTGIGHSDHHKERCLVIEIICDSGKIHVRDGKEADIIAICREINSDNHQKCCLVTSEIVNTMLIAERRRPA